MKRSFWLSNSKPKIKIEKRPQHLIYKNRNENTSSTGSKELGQDDLFWVIWVFNSMLLFPGRQESRGQRREAVKNMWCGRLTRSISIQFLSCIAWNKLLKPCNASVFWSAKCVQLHLFLELMLLNHFKKWSNCHITRSQTLPPQKKN